MPRARIASVAASLAAANLAAWGPAAIADPRLFLIDGYGAQLSFRCDVLGMMPVEGGFSRFIAVISLDPASPGEARAVVRVDAGSMALVPSGWTDQLRGPDFFDVARYPEFTFTSSSAHVIAPGLVRLDGDLTLRGVAQPFSLSVRYTVANDGHGGATIAAAGELDRTKFGMTAYDMLLSDDVSITVAGATGEGVRPIIPGGG